MLVSWCLAAGVQWDLLQAFAWGRMFADYAKQQSIGRALQSTFAPENVCGLCVVAQEGRKAQDEQPLAHQADAKFLAMLVPQAGIVFEKPIRGEWQAPPVSWTTERRARPPLPPPRHA